jgi:TRAP-type transport system small permease protein
VTATSLGEGEGAARRSALATGAAVLAAAEEWTAAACLVGIAALINFQFLDRFSGDPYVWTEEVARVLMIWMACLGVAAVTRRGVHIGVDAVLVRLSGRVRSVYFRVIETLTGLVLAFVCWQAILLLHGSRGVELASTEWPIAVIIWAMICGAGLGAIHALVRAVTGPDAGVESSPVIQDA